MNNFDEKKLIQEFSKIQIKVENNFQIEEIQSIAGVDLAYCNVNKTIYGDIYGRVLRTSYCVKPIFVSGGNWIDLATSTEVAMNCINNESRLPIPVRLADLRTHKIRKNS